MEKKIITSESEAKLEKSFDLLSEITVNGQNVFRMATALQFLQEISAQINTPPEEGENEKEE